MHEDLKVSIDDFSSGRRMRMEGGKADTCEYIKQTAPAFKLVLSAMNVVREVIEVKHEWTHPWTAEVSYTVRRSMSMARGAMQNNAIGDDQVTLVNTLGGVNIRRLVAVTKLNMRTC